MNKKILLAAPLHFEIYKMLINNLEHLGFEVVFLHIDDNFKYRSKKDRVINFLRKTFLGDKKYKRTTLRNKYILYDLYSQLNTYPKNHFDYSLFIRPDLYPVEIIKQINIISKKNIAYQWDGMDRYPEVYKIIELFDKFYVFDINDYTYLKPKYSNLYLTHNFYPTTEPNAPTKKCDIYYVGTYSPDRFDDFIDLYNQLNRFDLKFNILIHSNDQEAIDKYQNKDLRFFQKPIAYDENLALLKEAKIVLDIKVNHHLGLSFRFYEALKYHVKIITNNPNVKNYDFYNKNNIYIISHDPIEELAAFIKSEYVVISTDIYNKYSFNTWIKEILN